MSKPAASVVIPTRNRREILRECLLAAGRQTVPVEIVVVDDGSTDGTPEMVRAEFPQARYQRFGGQPRGPAFIRNRGSEMAGADILFPLDDDAVLISPRTVEQTLAEFGHPRVGAVGIPFINVRKDAAKVNQRAPQADGQIYLCHAYVGASHALQRELFLSLGGYRETLFYMGEEGDYTLRMLAAGAVVRLGNADPIHHHESPRRASWRADYYGRRNDGLFVWQHVPWPALPLHLAATVGNGLRAALGGVSSPGHMALGILAGSVGGLRHLPQRRPVTQAVYQLHRYLKKHEPVPLREVEARLPVLRSPAVAGTPPPP